MLVNITYRESERHVVSFVDALLQKMLRKGDRQETTKTFKDGEELHQINYFCSIKPMEDFLSR